MGTSLILNKDNALTTNLETLRDRISNPSFLKKIEIPGAATQPTMEKMKKGKNPTSYKPSQNKMNALSALNEELFYFIESFSFSKVNYDTSQVFNELFKKMFNFSQKQLKLMTNETKQAVIDVGMEGISKTFIAARHTFFSKKEMVESDYLERRLEYLLTHSEEPVKVYTNQEYQYITEQFLLMMRKAMEAYLYKETQFILYDKARELMNDFYLNILKEIDSIIEPILFSLSVYFQEKVRSNQLTQQEKDHYFSYKKCLLTLPLDYHFNNMQKYVGDDFFLIIYNDLSIFLKHPDKAVNLLTVDSANKLTNYMTRYVELFEETYPNDTVENSKWTEAKANMKKFVETVPTLLNELTNIPTK